MSVFAYPLGLSSDVREAWTTISLRKSFHCLLSHINIHRVERWRESFANESMLEFTALLMGVKKKQKKTSVNELFHSAVRVLDND